MARGYEIPTLTGERVALRPIEPEENGQAHRWLMAADPLLQTCRPVTLRSVASVLREPEGRGGPSAARIAVVLRVNDALIGRVRYFDLNPRNRSAEIGYLIAPESRGKGFGREAVGLLLRFLFHGLGLNKAYAQTGAFNLPSIRMLESIGFHRDAVLREHHFYEGRFQDDHIYSLLAREWKERPAPGDSK